MTDFLSKLKSNIGEHAEDTSYNVKRQCFADGGMIKSPQTFKNDNSLKSNGSANLTLNSLKNIWSSSADMPSFAEGGSVKAQAKKLANMGRDGDTELVHVNKDEEKLLKAYGGRGSINPKTGLREYPWFGDNPDFSWCNPCSWYSRPQAPQDASTISKLSAENSDEHAPLAKFEQGGDGGKTKKKKKKPLYKENPKLTEESKRAFQEAQRRQEEANRESDLKIEAEWAKSGAERAQRLEDAKLRQERQKEAAREQERKDAELDRGCAREAMTKFYNFPRSCYYDHDDLDSERRQRSLDNHFAEFVQLAGNDRRAVGGRRDGRSQVDAKLDALSKRKTFPNLLDDYHNSRSEVGIYGDKYKRKPGPREIFSTQHFYQEHCSDDARKKAKKTLFNISPGGRIHESDKWLLNEGAKTHPFNSEGSTQIKMFDPATKVNIGVNVHPHNPKTPLLSAHHVGRMNQIEAEQNREALAYEPKRGKIKAD